jgi:hypothetical protein
MAKRDAKQFDPGIVKASKSVILELGVILKSYFEDLVLIGGWAPYFISQKYQTKGFDHVGSIDIDIAVNPKITERRYGTIINLIRERGYQTVQDELADIFEFRFERRLTSPHDKKEYTIGIDFLTSHLGDKRIEAAHRRVQTDLQALKAKGCELVFDHFFTMEIKDILPGDGEATCKWKVADIVGSLVMKSFALGGRYKEKDAYDIHYLIANYKDSPLSVSEEFKPYLDNKIIQESLSHLKNAFLDIRSNGPAWVANFYNLTNEREREVKIASVYKDVNKFLKDLGLI